MSKLQALAKGLKIYVSIYIHILPVYSTPSQNPGGVTQLSHTKGLDEQMKENLSSIKDLSDIRKYECCPVTTSITAVLRSGYPPTLDSEGGWTGDFWSITRIAKPQGLYFSFHKKYFCLEILLRF